MKDSVWWKLYLFMLIIPTQWVVNIKNNYITWAFGYCILYVIMKPDGFLAETHHLSRLLRNKELRKWVIILLVKYIAQWDRRFTWK